MSRTLINSLGIILAKQVSYQCGIYNENKLASAVIQRAIFDLFIPFENTKAKPIKKSILKNGYIPKSMAEQRIEEQRKAYNWIFKSPDFDVICEYADINPDWLKPKLVKAYKIYNKLYLEFKNEKSNNTSKKAITT